MQPDFEKSNEIYFRLGIIYKQQQKYQSSLEVSTYLLSPIIMTDCLLVCSASDILCLFHQHL